MYDIRAAAYGMARVARLTSDPLLQSSLAYVAVYASGLTHGDPRQYQVRLTASMDTAFVRDLLRKIPDEVLVTGWRITEVREHDVLLTNGKIRACAARESVVGSLKAGATAFKVSALRPGVSPGFVVRQSSKWSAGNDDLVRFYLNIRPSGAYWALGVLSDVLFRNSVPFQVKVLAHPRAYHRRDSCVVYVPASEAARTLKAIEHAVDKGRGLVLAPSVPRLTARLLSGVGFAHEPTDVSSLGLSHGEWVSGILVKAASQAKEPGDIVPIILEEIVSSGRDPAKPHLRSGSLDPFAVEA